MLSRGAGRSRAGVAVVALAALALGVVAVRGGTAAEDSDLAAPSAPPTVEASEPPFEVTRLEANGLPGLRLGARPAELLPVEDADGCEGAWDPAATTTSPEGGWLARGWARDGRVVSVVLQAWEAGERPGRDLVTWLGPSIGSPMASAQDLPGARWQVHQPFGASGPTVTVTVVPLGGAEVVYADAPADPSAWGGGRDGAEGVTPVITSVEVRRPEGRVCEGMADFLARTDVADLVVDDTGVGPVRLGAPVQDLIDAGVLVDSAPGDDATGCHWLGSDTLPLSVRSQEGVVVEVGSHGPVRDAFGVPPGAGVPELVAVFPQLAGGEETIGLTHTAEIDLGSSRVRVDLFPQPRQVPDLDAPVWGGDLLVDGWTVRAADVDDTPGGC